MFFSVDLSGSTSVKDSLHVHHHVPVWLPAFEAFFRDFPELFLKEIDKAFSGAESTAEVFVWKLIGDEIVFKAQPVSSNQAALLVCAFDRAVVKYDRTLFEEWPLRVKGTVWAARFEERNIELKIPERMHWKDDDQTIHSDYLGPDVDTGFRISHHAPAGGVIISLNLAEAIASISGEFGLKFHYVGREVLKGVFSGRPYPLILISLADCPSDLWKWEVDETDYADAVQAQEPMQPDELRGLSERIRTYLNRMCHLQLSPLAFD